MAEPNPQQAIRQIRQDVVESSAAVLFGFGTLMFAFAVVRNLLLGHKMARAFGGVMKAGYTPFSFGHTEQLPQIYAGFGIDTCLFYLSLIHISEPTRPY